MLAKQVLLACSLVFSLLLTQHVQAALVFDFNNGTEFDNANGGAMMLHASNTVTLTSVDILAPEYNGALTRTGKFLSAANGDGVKTNIQTSENAVGVNNPSISNSQHGTLGGPSANESGNFNPEESRVIDFDRSVIISLFNFSSLSSGDSFEFSIDGAGTFTFANSSSADDYADSLGDLVIDAGKNITFTAQGTFATTDIRISENRLIAVPEPGSIAALMETLLGTTMLLERNRSVA